MPDAVSPLIAHSIYSLSINFARDHKQIPNGKNLNSLVCCYGEWAFWTLTCVWQCGSWLPFGGCLGPHSPVGVENTVDLDRTVLPAC